MIDDYFGFSSSPSQSHDQYRHPNSQRRNLRTQLSSQKILSRERSRGNDSDLSRLRKKYNVKVIEPEQQTKNKKKSNRKSHHRHGSSSKHNAHTHESAEKLMPYFSERRNYFNYNDKGYLTERDRSLRESSDKKAMKAFERVMAQEVERKRQYEAEFYRLEANSKNQYKTSQLIEEPKLAMHSKNHSYKYFGVGGGNPLAKNEYYAQSHLPADSTYRIQPKNSIKPIKIQSRQSLSLQSHQKISQPSQSGSNNRKSTSKQDESNSNNPPKHQESLFQIGINSNPRLTYQSGISSHAHLNEIESINPMDMINSKYRLKDEKERQVIHSMDMDEDDSISNSGSLRNFVGIPKTSSVKSSHIGLQRKERKEREREDDKAGSQHNRAAKSKSNISGSIWQRNIDQSGLLPNNTNMHKKSSYEDGAMLLGLNSAKMEEPKPLPQSDQVKPLKPSKVKVKPIKSKSKMSSSQVSHKRASESHKSSGKSDQSVESKGSVVSIAKKINNAYQQQHSAYSSHNFLLPTQTNQHIGLGVFSKEPSNFIPSSQTPSIAIPSHSQHSHHPQFAPSSQTLSSFSISSQLIQIMQQQISLKQQRQAISSQSSLSSSTITFIQKVQAHLYALNFIIELVQMVEQIYSEDSQWIFIQVLLTFKKFYLQRVRVVKALRGGKTCFTLQPTQISQQQLSNSYKLSPIYNLMKDIETINNLYGKTLHQFYQYILSKNSQLQQQPLVNQRLFNNDEELGVLMKEFHFEIQVLLPKQEEEEMDSEDIQLIHFRVFKIFEVVFLISQIGGDKLKDLEEEIDFENYNAFEDYYRHWEPYFTEIVQQTQ